MLLLSEGPIKITKSVIDAAWRRRAVKQRLIIRDAECRGLALVINANSASWTYSYKPRGLDPGTGKRFSTRDITIGNLQSHSADDARSAVGRHFRFWRRVSLECWTEPRCLHVPPLKRSLTCPTSTSARYETASSPPSRQKERVHYQLQ